MQRATRNVGTGTGNDTPYDHFAIRMPESGLGLRLLHLAKGTLAQETKEYTPTGKFLANTAVSIGQNLPT